MYKRASSYLQHWTRHHDGYDPAIGIGRKKKKTPKKKWLQKPLSNDSRTKLLKELGGAGILTLVAPTVRALLDQGIRHPLAISQRLNAAGIPAGNRNKKWNPREIKILLQLVGKAI